MNTKYSLKRAPKSVGLTTVEPLHSGHHWGMNRYRGVALSQGLICTNRVHLGLSEVGVLTSGVTFRRGSTV